MMWVDPIDDEDLGGRPTLCVDPGSALLKAGYSMEHYREELFEVGQPRMVNVTPRVAYRRAIHLTGILTTGETM